MLLEILAFMKIWGFAKAILGIGKVDIAYPDMLCPRDEGVRILGASSDHKDYGY